MQPLGLPPGEAEVSHDIAGKAEASHSDETLSGIRDGAIDATVVQQTYEFGYQAITRMAQAARGDRSFIPATKQIIVPTLVNRSNVDEFTKRINELRGRAASK